MIPRLTCCVIFSDGPGEDDARGADRRVVVDVRQGEGEDLGDGRGRGEGVGHL